MTLPDSQKRESVETAQKCGESRDGSPTRSCRQRVDPTTGSLCFLAEKKHLTFGLETSFSH